MLNFLATHPVIGTGHIALSSLSITRGVAQAAGSKLTKDDERLVEEGMVEFMELKAGNQAAQRAAQGAKAMERPLPRRHCLAAKLTPCFARSGFDRREERTRGRAKLSTTRHELRKDQLSPPNPIEPGIFVHGHRVAGAFAAVLPPPTHYAWVPSAGYRAFL